MKTVTKTVQTRREEEKDQRVRAYRRLHRQPMSGCLFGLPCMNFTVEHASTAETPRFNSAGVRSDFDTNLTGNPGTVKIDE